jgi:hypothetical protein
MCELSSQEDGFSGSMTNFGLVLCWFSLFTLSTYVGKADETFVCTILLYRELTAMDKEGRGK